MAVVVEQPDPFTSGIGAAAGYLLQKRQNQQDATDNDLKRRQVEAQIANATANTDLAKRGFDLEQRTQGIDPATGQPFQYSVGENQVSSPKSSLEHRAAVAEQLAAEAAGKGASVPAQRYTAVANGLRMQAHQANQDALDFRKQYAKELQDRAQREHWSSQDRLKAQEIGNQLFIGIRNGDIRIQAAQIAAGAHLQGISMSSAAAMQRTKYVQGQENSRSAATRAAAAAAAAVRTKNSAAQFNALHPGSNYSPQLPGGGGVVHPPGAQHGTFNGKSAWKYPDGSMHDDTGNVIQ